MKKRMIIVLLSLITIVMLCFGLAGCGGEDEPTQQPTVTYTITFNSNGGSYCPSITDELGKEIDLPTPTKEGYTFDGWFTDNNTFETSFTATTITENITLYAKWTEIGNTTEHTHNYSSEWASDDVNHWHVCTSSEGTCDAPEEDLNTHKWNDGKITTQATSEHDGVKTYTCTVCGKTKEEPFAYTAPDHEHQLTPYSANTATCTEDGNIAYWYCSGCDKYFSDEAGTTEIAISDTMIRATGHTYVNGECAVCHEKKPSEGLVYTLSNDGSYYIVSGIGACTDVDIVISAEYNQKPVTGIGASAFRDCSSLTSITIPKDITNIGYRAFYNCTALTEINYYAAVCNDLSSDNYVFYRAGQSGDGITVNIGSDVQRIPAWLFCPYDYDSSYFTKIITVNFTENSVCESIGNGAFCNCIRLWRMTIPDSVTRIGDDAFYNCSGLNSITIPEGVTSIGDDAFYNCNNLGRNSYNYGYYLGNTNNPYMVLIEAWSTNISSCTINEKCKFIYSSVFYNCSRLTSITIPNGVMSIGASAFQKCSSLTSLTIPYCVTSIGNGAFYGCSSLTSLTIPDSVTSIGASAFYYCSSLTSLTIPDSVASIRNYAFENCGSLKTVTIGNGVTSIGSSAFENCGSLTSVYYNGNIEDWCSIEFSDAYSNPLYYAHRLFIDNKLVTEIEIPSTVTKIGKYQFIGWNGTKITIPDSITSMGSSAFGGCSNLTSIAIPDSVTSIDSSAFGGCSNLTDITIPESVTSIGNYVLYNCSSLTSVTIPDSVTSIGNYAFSGCSNLTDITIPESVTSIGNYAFYNCSSLTSITIPDSITSIGDGAFSNCTVLIEINYNATACNNLSINNYVFYSVGQSGDGIVVNIGSNVQKIPAYLFYPSSKSGSNPKITTVNFAANSVCETIGKGAFENCSNLTSLTIPDSVTSIGDSAFSNCDNLRYIEYDNGYYLGNTNNSYVVLIKAKNKDITSCTINESCRVIYYSAFYECSNLTGITLPDSVMSIGDYAFYNCRSLTSITLPDSVMSVGEYSFYNCRSLTSITLPDSVMSVGEYSFYNCSSLTSVTIPDSVTSVGNYAFYNCTALTEINYCAVVCNDLSSDNYVFYSVGQSGDGIVVNIGSNVQKIPAYLFYPSSKSGSDPKITTINFAENSLCESIGSSAFENCGSLTSVYYNGNIEDWCSIEFSDAYSNPLYYAHRLFIDNKLVTKIEIPGTVTKIGTYQFVGWNGTEITIPDSVTSIGNGAFSNCDNLRYNEYDNAYYLGNTNNPYILLVKAKNTLIESCTINDNCKFIHSFAFQYVHLTGITIPDSVTSIGNYAFYNCGYLTYVTIGNGVTNIGGYAFCNCSSLTSVTIGNGVTSIGDGAFFSCSMLMKITIPDSVTHIGSEAFNYCNRLGGITFSDTTTWYRTTNRSNFENMTGGTQVDVTNASTNVTYFNNTYVDFYWYKL